MEPDDERERTAVYWEAEFDANGVSDDEAIKRGCSTCWWQV